MLSPHLQKRYNRAGGIADMLVHLAQLGAHRTGNTFKATSDMSTEDNSTSTYDHVTPAHPSTFTDGIGLDIQCVLYVSGTDVILNVVLDRRT